MLDKSIEELVKSCKLCQAGTSSHPVAPVDWAVQAIWQRIHVDFAGPFLGSMFLIAVDAHSKWPEVYPMSTMTTKKTIEVLWHIFASHGLPMQVVTDNRPQFMAEEFAMFLRNNSVKHIRAIPYHLVLLNVLFSHLSKLCMRVAMMAD